MLNLDKNKKYLLACSYGPDSMALFSMLLKEGYKFDVAHVNYHFRKESDQEEQGLKEFATRYNIKIHIYDNKEKVTKNLEAKARDIRYNFFARVYQENKFDALLVAHHEDDLIETYLMQKKKNLHVFYYGIKENSFSYNMNITRPLLNYSKEELLNYCKDNNVPYALDASNNELTYERNKIRHGIVNKLSSQDRSLLLMDIELLNYDIEVILEHLNKIDIHSICELKTLYNDELIYAIELLANECQIFKISTRNINDIIKIIYSKKPNVILSYKSYSFVKEYDQVYFTNTLDEKGYLYVIEHPEELDTQYFYLNFLNGASDRNVSQDDYPLTIRNALPKDQIKIKDYYKEARRLFIDWKMPVSLRKRWPVIVNKDNEIIYIPRYQKGFKAGKNLNFYVK